MSWKLLQDNWRISGHPCWISKRAPSLSLWKTVSLNRTRQKTFPTCKHWLQRKSPVWSKRHFTEASNSIVWRSGYHMHTLMTVKKQTKPKQWQKLPAMHNHLWCRGITSKEHRWPFVEAKNKLIVKFSSLDFPTNKWEVNSFCYLNQILRRVIDSHTIFTIFIASGWTPSHVCLEFFFCYNEFYMLILSRSFCASLQHFKE